MEESLSIKPKLEALLVAARRPVAVADLARCLGTSVARWRLDYVN
jgi:chromosome segregation and condensation protein ScpB